MQGLTYLFKVLSWKCILLQPYIRWIKTKNSTNSPTNFPSPQDNIFLKTTENKFIVWNYHFSGRTTIYLFELSNINCRIKCNICSKLTIEAPDVVLLKAHCQVRDNSWQLKPFQKWWKMPFISPQKLFSFPKYWRFWLDFLVMYETGLIKMLRFISNFMTSQPE